MISAAAKMNQRILLWHLLFSLVTGVVVAVAAPTLLLLSRPVAEVTTRALLLLSAAGSLVGWARSWWRLRRHRYVLRALALGSRAVEPHELADLSREPLRATLGWLVPIVLSLSLLTTPLRPQLMDLSTGVSIALLSSLIAGAASLLLSVVARRSVLRVIELAPPEVMSEVLDEARHTELPRRPVPRRLLAALGMPVLFLAVGSALITNSHLRRADERDREETARALARATLELRPGVVLGAGRKEAIRAAAAHGFKASTLAKPGGYRLTRQSDGVLQLSTPLDDGSARVRFEGSTVPVLGLPALLIALLAVALAAAAGALVGRELLRDLKMVTRGISVLGTEAVLSGDDQIVTRARFAAVGSLGQAITQLARRFRVFAHAQERAIQSQEGAARMRGLFFASVSHDLKSPLNAILGFTELVRLEPLTAEQEESLELIERRGRELLALIETILDAARVEAKQLDLVREEVSVEALLEMAQAQAHHLSGDSNSQVRFLIEPDLPELSLDRIRFARALATLMGHSLRSIADSIVEVRVTGRGDVVRFEVEVPASRPDARELGQLLNPGAQPGARRHRGLALGLSLARAVIALHGGRVLAEPSSPGAGSVFVVSVPWDGEPAP